MGDLTGGSGSVGTSSRDLTHVSDSSGGSLGIVKQPLRGKKHRSLFGSILHQAERVPVQTVKDIGSSLEHLPGGVAQIAKAEYHDIRNPSQGPSFQHPGRGQVAAIAKAQGKQVATDVSHPGRHPGYTLMDLTLATPLVGGVARVAEAGRALSLGEGAGAVGRALVEKPVMPSRPLGFHPSQAPVSRVVQAAHDRIVQRELAKRPAGIIAKYANRRIGTALSETRGRVSEMHRAQVQTLRAALKDVPKKQRQVAQDAVMLVSENTPPDVYLNTLATHGTQAPDLVARLKAVERAGIVRDVNGHLEINAERFPHAKALDTAFLESSKVRDQIMVHTGEMTPAGIETRINAPNQIHGVDRPGRNYVGHRLFEPSSRKLAPPKAISGVVGGVRRIAPTTQHFTGATLKKGLVPADIVEHGAQGLSTALRKLHTVESRREISTLGKDIKTTPSDVLVSMSPELTTRMSDFEKGRIGAKTLRPLTEEQTLPFWQQVWHETFPEGVSKNEAPLGEVAPEGYKWVPSQILGDMREMPQVKADNALVKTITNVNAATTQLTIYWKAGHILTRAGTNAFANLMQGSLRPLKVRDSIRMWKALSTRDKARAIGSAGQGFGASFIPDTRQTSLAVRGAKFGSHLYSKYTDAPFRFNSLVNEAARDGITTPTAFRKMLNDMENPFRLPPERRAVVERIAQAANREQIAYNRLTPFEKRYVARYMWFYPWTRASLSYLGHTFVEHPAKLGALVQTGRVGQQAQQAQLGDLPWYAQGLFKVGGNSEQPLVQDLSTVSPFTTLAQITHPGVDFIGEHLNPALAGLYEALTGKDQFGRQLTMNQRIAALAKEPLAPTLEAGLVKALHGGSKSFPVGSPLEALLQALTKPAAVKHANLQQLHKSAGLEKTGRR